MDATMQGVLIGVVANVITSFLGYASEKVSTVTGRRGLHDEREIEHMSLRPTLEKAVQNLADTMEWPESPRVEGVCLFLESQEVRTILRQVFSARLAADIDGNTASPDMLLLRQTFLKSFKSFVSEYLNVDQFVVTRLGESLFGKVIQVCETALDIAVDKGILSAHEAKSNFRYQIILNEIAGLKAYLSFLKDHEDVNLTALRKFETDFLEVARGRFGFITPPNFDSNRKLPIDELYVSPSLTSVPKRKTATFETYSYKRFMNRIYRAVVLGNPGGGKSTLALKLCSDLATSDGKIGLLAGRSVIPILIVLRDYAVGKKEHSYSILDFVEASVNSDFQLKAPSGAVEHLLLNGQAIVIFDGLDELLDTSYRQRIASDVESFCRRYPSVPILVTSREVGYEQAPLDEGLFESFRLAPFDDLQTKSYVSKWFRRDTDLTAEQYRRRVDAFLEESASVPDLRSNPLMLALLCNIYQGENYLPRKRPDVYEKCATMLFERWDRSRNIGSLLPFEAHLRPALAYLAHWIYESAGLRSGVTEAVLTSKAADYLHEWRFDNRDEAEHAAAELIGYCRGRAWVFTDTGTTKDGEKLYQFTHTTFLEYFTAIHLVRTHPTPEDLISVLLPHISRREWDVVAQLSFQLQNKNIQGAGDTLLLALLESASHPAFENRLAFAARCLEFIVPRPQVARGVALASCNCVLDPNLRKGDHPTKRSRIIDLSDISIDIVSGLVTAAEENCENVSIVISDIISQSAEAGTSEEAARSLELGLHLCLALSLSRHWTSPGEAYEYWSRFAENLAQEHKSLLVSLSGDHFALCVDALTYEFVTVSDLVKWHGLAGIVRSQSLSLFPNIYGMSVIDRVLLPMMQESIDQKTVENVKRQLRDIGQLLLSSPTPWIPANTSLDDVFGRHILYSLPNSALRGVLNRMEFSKDETFGLFAIIGLLIEFTPEVTLASLTRIKPWPEQIQKIVQARYAVSRHKLHSNQFLSVDFSDEQRDFIESWVRHDLKLVEVDFSKRRNT